MEKKWVALCIFIITVFFLLPWIVWQIEDPKEMEVVILNKTVPDFSYREHKSIIWLLNNQNYVKRNTGDRYAYKTDYYGFFPKENNKYVIRDLPALTEAIDLIYIADTYGVYAQEYYGDNPLGERSELLYGGMQQEEVEKIRKAMYAGSTLVAEFNTFGSPTHERVRTSVYELLGLTWTGWMGRYFEDMSIGVEVPNWAVENYEQQQGRSWDFEGNGFLFVDENDTVIALGASDIMQKGVQLQFTQTGEEFFGKRGKYDYRYWVDIIEADPLTTVLANYHLTLSVSGEEKLKSMGIPTIFPAVTKNQNALYTSYYFAGDYADYAHTPRFYQVAGLTKILQFFSIGREDTFFWKAYVPMMKKILQETHEKKQYVADKKHLNKTYLDQGTQLIARTQGDMLQIHRDNQWEDIFVKGVNVGIAMPGKWFTEFPEQESTYFRWFEQIGKMHANSIRVYTLMHPSFYRALLRYNLQNPQEPLWLLQEVWPEEHPPGNDYLAQAYVDEFLQEIEYAVDAIHGNVNIPERRGRAYGDYYADVSMYTLAYLVGREFEPEEVIETNEKNDINAFKGNYLIVEEGSPTEVWLAKSCDYLLDYQEKQYGWQHPVAIVSWPTLDVMEHDAEWNEQGDKDLEYNDRVSIDIRNFLLGDKMKAGFFGAYHIYPNYPDFINNTPSYAEYQDEEGTLRYGGYLEHFMRYHEGYPALVAEFGLATGMGNAHVSPDGYHHGAMTEKQQGEGVVRMMKAIERERYAGGVIFEWMDEWAKKTWTTEPFMIPYEHNVFWHNAIDPEQNYGILAVESIKPEQPQSVIKGENKIRQLKMAGNEAYLYIDIKAEGLLDLTDKKLLIGLDTYDAQKGSFYYGEDISLKAPTGMEFLVELSAEEGQLLVIPEYNITRYRFASVENSQGGFETINPIINSQRVTKSGEIIEEIREESSKLNYGQWTGSFNHWYQTKDGIYLRLPWGRLNVTDPTTYQVVDDSGVYFDYPARDVLNTTTTEGIRITVILVDEQNQIIDKIPNDFQETIQPFKWESWGEPRYTKRLKESYDIIKEYFKSIK